jgi:sulfur-carrier protein
MAVVFIPSLLRSLSQGQSQVEIQAATVGEALDILDRQYAGLKERLVEGDHLNPTLILAVDGTVSRKGLRQVLQSDSEIHFLPVMAGG